MSTLKVDSLVEKTSGNGVHIADHIVQTVQLTHAGTGTTNLGRTDLSASSGFVDIMSKTITTKTANSKILVLCKCTAHLSTSTMQVQSRILADSTELYTDPYAWYGVANEMDQHTVIHLHSPNASAGTTITFKLQANNTGNGTTYMKYADSGGTCHSSLTLMEIAQ